MARKADADPVGALRRKVRRDAGSHPSIGAGLEKAIHEQHAAHHGWSYKLHYDNLGAQVRLASLSGPLPSYSMIRRFMRSKGLSRAKGRRTPRTAGAEAATQRFEAREVRSYESTHAGALFHADFHECSRALRRGTLKDTCQHLVEVSSAGQTHEELALIVHVRVHNTLLDLVQAGRVGRESVGPTFLYVSAEHTRAALQVQERLRLLQAETPATQRRDSDVVIEVLLELVRAAKELPFTTTGLTRRLHARGVGVTQEEVADVLREHGIAKKRPPQQNLWVNSGSGRSPSR